MLKYNLVKNIKIQKYTLYKKWHLHKYILYVSFDNPILKFCKINELLDYYMTKIQIHM